MPLLQSWLKRTIYDTFTVGPMKKRYFPISLIRITKVLEKYCSLSKELFWNIWKLPSLEANNKITNAFSFREQNYSVKWESKEFSSVKKIFQMENHILIY